MSQTDLPTVPQAARVTWWKLALAAGSGLLLYLCFPPADLGPLVWVALIPLFFALTQVRPWGGLALGLVFGFVFMGMYAAFMLRYGRFEWFATVSFEVLFVGAFGAAAAACNRSPHPAVRALAVAGAWTLAEMLRGGIGRLGFTVGNLGYTQHDLLPMIQAASVVGHYGVGFFIAMLNAAVAQAVLAVAPGVWVRPALRPRAFAQLAARTALAGYVLVLLIYVWGAIILKGAQVQPDETLEVAVVQGVLGESAGATREDALIAQDTYLALSQPIPETVELIVWPEVAVPTPLNRSPSHRRAIAGLADDKSAWVITGAWEYGPAGRVFNSLFLFTPEGDQTQVYRKVLLVPFGESVPMRDRFPWLAKFTLRNVDFSPGEAHKTLDVGRWEAGPLICFEGLFPHAVRANTRLGADFIVLATSDAWAAGTHEIAQHSATAPLRAVEARRWVVRAGTWGRSQIISPWGEVIDDVPVAQRGAAWGEIEPRQELSAYHRYGDTPMLVICALLVVGGWLGLPGLRYPDEEGEPSEAHGPHEEESGDG